MSAMWISTVQTMGEGSPLGLDHSRYVDQQTIKSNDSHLSKLVYNHTYERTIIVKARIIL